MQSLWTSIRLKHNANENGTAITDAQVFSIRNAAYQQCMQVPVSGPPGGGLPAPQQWCFQVKSWNGSVSDRCFGTTDECHDGLAHDFKDTIAGECALK
jgi:hypothetical protein